MEKIELEINKILCKYLNITNISSKESLFGFGMDSMTLLFIINDIETFFSITIPDDELLLSNFETVYQMSCLVNKIKEGYKNTNEKK